MKTHNLETLLGQPAPPPSPQTMENAWNAAACEFHRNINTRAKPSPIRWLWPLAVAATIAILCGIIVTQPTTHPTNITANPSTSSPRPNLTELYTQGRQLFGNQLQAVTVSKNSVVWHLSDDTSPTHNLPDQLITLTLTNNNTPDLYIATNPGSPVNLEYDGQTHQVEFLPDASDEIIAIGDGIYWDTHALNSPMKKTPNSKH